MEIAYLILAHTDPALVGRLSKVLKASGEGIFIHIDKKVDEKPFVDAVKKNGVSACFVKRRHNVFWGGFNSVKATIELLQTALQSSRKFQRFILLQNLDYPYWSGQEIKSFFSQYNDVEFIRACNISLIDDDYFTKKYQFPHFYDQKNRYIRGFLEIFSHVYKILPIKRKQYGKLFNKKCDLYWGSAQYAITRNLAELIVLVYNTEKEFNKYFKRVFAPDESYFHTIVYNSDFSVKTLFHGPEPTKKGLVNWRNLHLFTYEKEIKVYTIDDYDYISQNNCMFIRKVRSGISDTLLDVIDAKHLKYSPEYVSKSSNNSH